MKERIPVSNEGYAILKAYPLKDSNLVVTEPCHFCLRCHIHVNPVKDDRGNIPLRKSHCLNKSIVKIDEHGLSIGNHIYYLDVQEKEVQSRKLR